MQIGPFTIARTKGLQLSPLSASGNGWSPWGIIRESFTGAWQQNVEIRADTLLAYFAAFSCLTLIASDIGKLYLRLVEQDDNGIWNEIESPAFSPVLRRPNRYQTINKFVEQWIVSKLAHGNTYVLKQRDQRAVVVAMYVLDPTRVTPLVAPDGAVYYQLKRDDLSGLQQETVTVPASEIIHDTMVALFHPLIGVSPLYACGLAATQGLSIQNNSSAFFSNGSNPGGIIMVPGSITQPQADVLKASWDTNYSGLNVGKVALLTDGMKYESVGVNAVDSQLIEQLKMTAETVCSTFHVPPYLVDIGPPPPYANFEPLLLKYHSQCIQSLTTNFEKCLDHGLGMTEKVDGRRLGTEFDIDDLIWMDTATKVKAAGDSIGSGSLSPNEGRKKYYGYGPVAGGASPMVQQQYYSLAALAARDAGDPFAKPSPPQIAPSTHVDDDTDARADMAASFGAALRRKVLEMRRAA